MNSFSLSHSSVMNSKKEGSISEQINNAHINVILITLIRTLASCYYFASTCSHRKIGPKERKTKETLAIQCT